MREREKETKADQNLRELRQKQRSTREGKNLLNKAKEEKEGEKNETFMMEIF